MFWCLFCWMLGCCLVFWLLLCWFSVLWYLLSSGSSRCMYIFHFIRFTHSCCFWLVFWCLSCWMLGCCLVFWLLFCWFSVLWYLLSDGSSRCMYIFHFIGFTHSCCFWLVFWCPSCWMLW